MIAGPAPLAAHVSDRRPTRHPAAIRWSLIPTSLLVRSKFKRADCDFANSLINIIKDHRLRARLLTACAGSGRKLVSLLAAEAKKATPKERTLAFTEWQAFAMRPFMGELTLETFEAHCEEYDKLRNRVVGDNMRGTDITVVQHICTVMYRDHRLCNIYVYVERFSTTPM